MANKTARSAADQSTSEFGVDSAKGGIVFTAASIARAIGTLLLLIVLARLLKPADYGLYTIVIAVGMLLGLNTDYGVNQAVRKKLPEAKTNERKLSIIANAYFGAVCIAIIIAIIGIIASGYIATNLYKNAALTYPIMIVAASLVFSTLLAVTIGALIGLRKSKEAGAGYITYAAVQLIVSSILVLLGYGLIGALAGLLISFIAGFIVVFILLIREIEFRFIMPSKKVLKELFGFSTPIFASNALSNGTAALAVVFLGLFVTSTVVGNYGAAYKLATFAEVIIIALTQILLPAYSFAISSKKLAAKVESIYNSSVYYTLVLLLPLVIYAISVSRPLISTLLSGSYTLAPAYFSIITVGIVATIIYRYGGTLVVGYGRVKDYAKYVIGTAAVIVLLLLVLTPIFKVYGVLISLFVIGPILFDAVFLRFMSKELKVRFEWSKPLRTIATSLIILPILLFASSIMVHHSITNLAVNAIITIILFPPLLALLKGISKKDIKFIRSVSSRLHVLFAMKYVLGYTGMFLRKEK